MSVRTLPVTPAERRLATVLRAWLEWCNDGAQMKGTEDATMMDLWPVFQERGLVTAHMGQATPIARALLARVEAEHTTVQWRGSVEALVDDLRGLIPAGQWIKLLALFMPRDTVPTVGRVEAEERTPAAVLRAMLASYEAAALDAAREWSRTASEDMWGPISVHDMAGAISLIRLALAWLLESRPDPIGRFFSRALAADYAARLAGTTPIAAPPAKEPR